MESLVFTKFNWRIFFGIAIFLLLFFPGLSWYSYFAILISIHQFLLLFFALDYVLPIRYLFGSLMCLQMFIGPMLAYNGLDKYQYFMYQMKVSEVVYFSYVIPAVICFILGLHITAGKLKGEIIDEKKIRIFADHHRGLPFLFIGCGFISSVIAEFFSSDFAFVFYLLGNLKYIGAFLLVLSGKQLKILPLILVYGSIVISSLGEGMFHDLLTWLILMGAVLAIKYKPGVNIKIIVALCFVIFVIVIQQVKGSYRTATSEGQRAGVETFEKAYQEGQEKNALFSVTSLASSNVRINQGFIITNIMKTVPEKVPYSNGAELWQIIQAAILPRILAPDKLKAGDRTLFTRYTGMPLRSGTSMGLSSVGDAYINFGIVGGCIFMLVLGLVYNQVLKTFYKLGNYYPILILFTTIVFYYPIRPDCELQTILGHLVKSCFLIYVVFTIWKKYFIVYPQPPEKDIHTHPLVPSSL